MIIIPLRRSDSDHPFTHFQHIYIDLILGFHFHFWMGHLKSYCLFFCLMSVASCVLWMRLYPKRHAAYIHTFLSLSARCVLISSNFFRFHFLFFSLLFFTFSYFALCLNLLLLFSFLFFFSLLQNDELRKKLGDFNKVNKVQASMNDHNSSLEQEIKQLKAK